MRTLIFSDVHANLPAFEAVLEAAGSFDRAWFLGDVVGWGPFPAQCIDLLREIGARSVCGNHDAAIRKGPSKEAFVWDQWSFAQLDEGQLTYLRKLPERLVCPWGDGEEEALLIHKGTQSGYLKPDASPRQMAQLFAQGDLPQTQRILCGHYHHEISRSWEGRRYDCIRAVGQPRDRDARAGYAIEEDGVLTQYRVAYDVERTVAALARVGLEACFARRCAAFWRLGYDPEWSRL